MKKLGSILALVAALTLASCDDKPQKQYETTSKSRWTTMTMEAHWIGRTEIAETCTALENEGNPESGTGGGSGDPDGCARSKPGNDKVCEIYVVQPEDFDDADKLKVLGHEAWHCLGATHK